MILITGVTGYIGSRLAFKLLEQGLKVRGLVLPKEAGNAGRLLEMGMEARYGDLLDPAALKAIGGGITSIFHLAGIHSSLKKMEELYIQGTRNLIEACAHSPVEMCLIASNAAVYGDCGEELLTERSIPKPTHPFGIITLKMEETVLEMAETSSFPVAILRIAEVYGPGVFNFLKKVTMDNFSILGDGSNYTSRIHIHDLVDILRFSSRRLKRGDILNVSDDLPIRQKDFYGDICKIIGASFPKYIPLESVPDRIKLSIHGLRALSLRLSNKRMKSALNLHLRYPTFREGTAHLLNIE
jgi:nucleoside-diphosphate-sugar epimerase